MWLYQSTKTAKKFSVALDGAMDGASLQAELIITNIV